VAVIDQVRAMKRRCFYEAPALVAAYAAVGAVCLDQGWVWPALLMAFLAGATGGIALISLAWLRSHYRAEWDAA
jgi:hypothetical protein